MNTFDPDIAYLQSLKIVARGLIQWPTSRYELEQLVDGLKNVLWFSIGPIVRLLLLVSLPISAPLLTVLVQYERKKTAARIDAGKKLMRERLHKAAQARKVQKVSEQLPCLRKLHER